MIETMEAKHRRMRSTIEDVRNYWNTHLNLTQFLTDRDVSEGSREFYEQLERSLKRYAYKDTLLADFARGWEGRELLEVGCGLGLELVQLARLGFRVTGIDLAPKCVQLCNQNMAGLEIPGRALVENAEAMSFPSERFDAVYSCGVLQHTPNIDAAIGDIWRVLKPGGKILIVLYHRHSWFYALHRLSGVSVEFASDDAPIVNAYTRGELRDLFARFRDIQIDCEYCYPTPTKRQGVPFWLFNRLVVPACGLLPRSAVKRFGWHLVLTARK